MNRSTEKRTSRVIITTKDGIEHTLFDVSKSPGWDDVLALEQERTNGTLHSVTNHREKTFIQRYAELEASR